MPARQSFAGLGYRILDIVPTLSILPHMPARQPCLGHRSSSSGPCSPPHQPHRMPARRLARLGYRSLTSYQHFPSFPHMPARRPLLGLGHRPRAVFTLPISPATARQSLLGHRLSSLTSLPTLSRILPAHASQAALVGARVIVLGPCSHSPSARMPARQSLLRLGLSSLTSCQHFHPSAYQ
jgi:hypothetical protein